MFAHLIGNKDNDNIPGASAAVLLVGVIISIAVTVLGELLLPLFLSLMGTPDELFADSLMYLRIYLIGNAALFLYMQFTSIFRAFGDSLFQMKGMIITVLFNAIMDPFFIRPFGLAGAAAVTVASEILCLIYAVWYYKKNRLFIVDCSRMKSDYAKTMLSLSVPTTIQAIMPPISSAVMISFVSSFGVTALAGFGVARNLELIMFMPTTGMCMALSSIVGQCKGAGRLDRAKDYLKSGMLVGGLMTAILSFPVIMFSGKLTSLFGQGPAVATVVTTFFKIISIGYVLYMLTSCMQGYITGLGKPTTAMILLILYYIVFRIPATYWLSGVSGLSGVWIAFLVSHVMAFAVAIFMTIYPTRNRISITNQTKMQLN
jgi:putative MATE family efflux protein